MPDIEVLRERVRAFAEAREWERFHSPKNLAMALAGEVGELVELFQWLTEEDSRNLGPENAARAREEIADILIYLIRLADVLGVDLAEAARHKISVNEERYPVPESKGNATKYDRRG